MTLYVLSAVQAHAAPSHAFALFGEPKYKPGFTHFDYVNPDAPKGGQMTLMEYSVFDTLNPFITRGVKAPGTTLIFESLMTTSLDEPQTVYGVLAESIDIDPGRRFADFVLRKEARWQDGTPVTPEDVIFSFTTLKEKGDPVYRLTYQPITGVEKTGPRSVRFLFADPKNRELPIIAATMPILSKAFYTAHDFEKDTRVPPMGSGPYRIASFEPGRQIVYERVKDFWGENMPVSKGQNNFDRIVYDVYRDETVSLEAFKGGQYDFRQEYIARNWAKAYDSPALEGGRMIKREIKHKIPQGMQAFLFNTRLPKFSDRRVREAIGLTLDFEWANKNLFYSAYTRNFSIFQNSDFMGRGLPSPQELSLLEPLRDKVAPAVFTQEYNPSKTDGSGFSRANLVRAQALLDEAGWVLKDGVRVNANTGEKLTVTALLRQRTLERMLLPMKQNLARLGIGITIRFVDDAEYQKRVDAGQFDLISIWVNRGVMFPGNEQRTLWHSSQADVKGSNNAGGIKNPAVDALIGAIENTNDLETLTAASRALDRVILAEHYLIPHWHSSGFRIAWWDKFGMPAKNPDYDIGIMTWWMKK